MSNHCRKRIVALPVATEAHRQLLTEIMGALEEHGIDTEGRFLSVPTLCLAVDRYRAVEGAARLPYSALALETGALIGLGACAVEKLLEGR